VIARAAMTALTLRKFFMVFDCIPGFTHEKRLLHGNSRRKPFARLKYSSLAR
jgi:hypothetical protein